MNYSSNVVLSMNELYDNLVAFMTASGWSIHDNIPITGSRDKVLYSSGSDGKLNMYYRISTNQFGNPYRSAEDPHVKFPQVFIRGYHNWNAVTHSGSGEHGEFGPIVLAGDIWSASTTHWLFPYEKADGTLATPQYYSEYSMQTGASDSMGTVNTVGGITGLPGSCITATFDGRRHIWATYGNGLVCWDISNGESRYFDAGYGNLYFDHNAPVIIRDPNTDREYIYILAGNGQNLFLRFDVDNQSFGVAATWVSTYGCLMQWDGNDTIYVHQTVNNNVHAKYTISTNTWTTLAVSPVTFGARGRNSGLSSVWSAYVPSSVTGLGEDVIYYAGLTNSTTIYRYDVTSNAWRTTVPAGALTSPISITGTTMLFWDKKRYLHLWNPSTNLHYRSDLTSSPNTFNFLGYLDAGTRVYHGAIGLNFLVSKLKCSNVIPMKFFFHGDADSIRVVTRLGSNPGQGRYYWAYMGRFDSVYKSNIMRLTSPVSAGVRVTVPVDSSTGYAAGDSVTVANWSGSHFEKTTVYDISGPNAIICNLTSSFPASSSIGIDPSQTIVAGDTGKGCAAISCNGYKVDFEADYYYVLPEYDWVTNDKHNPSSRGSYMPVRYKIFNGEVFSITAGTTYGSRVNNSKAETLGYLKNVYALQAGAYPRPQNEDIVNVGGLQYVFFNPQYNNVRYYDKRGILIGPIN